MAAGTTTYWDRFADRYSAIGRARFWLDRRRALVADLPSRSRVLEACCGGGQLVVDLLQAGHDAYGEDLSPAMVARAQEALAAAGFDPRRVRQGDVTAIDHPDAAFDAVVCTGAIGLLDRATQKTALAEMARVAGDRVLLLEPLEKHPGLYAGRVLGWLFDGQRPIPAGLLSEVGLRLARVQPVLAGAFCLVEAVPRDPLDPPSEVPL